MAHPYQGANILKRTIEHMCSGPFDADRKDALNILNIAIEQCFEANRIYAENLARITSPAYARAQSAVTRAEKSIRKNVR